MPTDIYHNNLQALRTTYPQLADIITSAPDDTRFAVVREGVHPASVAYAISADQAILLHSKYDPVREAAKLVEGYSISPTVNVVILGFGFGYHIIDLVARKSKRDFIIICERNVAVIKVALANVDLSALFKQKNLMWFIGERPERINMLLKNKAFSVLANGVSVVLHPPSVQLDTNYYTNIKKAVEEFSVYARVNINTQIAKAEEFTRNAFANLEEYVGARPVSELFGIAHGMPVFIIGAGPSLDKTVGYLREVRNRGFIIAVDSAIATLLNHGIIPDLVVSIDFTKHTLKYFQDIDTSSLSLAFDLEICPDVPKMFKGKKYAIHLPKKSISEWITGIIGDKGAVDKGLSVSHSAALLATKMDAAAIILVGQDLAYPKSQWHTKGSHFFQNLEIADEQGLNMCETEDIFGQKAKTSTALMVFKNHFEMLIDQTPVPFYDATEGGAKIRGAQVISMKEAVIRFCTQKRIQTNVADNGSLHSVRAMYAVFKQAEQMVDVLDDFNHNVGEASLAIQQALEGFRQNKDREVLRGAICQVQTVIAKLDKDQSVLDLLKDNSTEAMLIRERKGFENVFDLKELSDEQIAFKLKKEQMFFSFLVRASAFVADAMKEFLQKHHVSVGSSTCS